MTANCGSNVFDYCNTKEGILGAFSLTSSSVLTLMVIYFVMHNQHVTAIGLATLSILSLLCSSFLATPGITGSLFNGSTGSCPAAVSDSAAVSVAPTENYVGGGAPCSNCTSNTPCRPNAQHGFESHILPPIYDMAARIKSATYSYLNPAADPSQASAEWQQPK